MLNPSMSAASLEHQWASLAYLFSMQSSFGQYCVLRLSLSSSSIPQLGQWVMGSQGMDWGSRLSRLNPITLGTTSPDL